MNYSKRVCQGLCQQADSLGLCMGICASSPEFAQQCYENFKSNCQKEGRPFTPIEAFENSQPKMEHSGRRPGR